MRSDPCTGSVFVLRLARALFDRALQGSNQSFKDAVLMTGTILRRGILTQRDVDEAATEYSILCARMVIVDKQKTRSNLLGMLTDSANSREERPLFEYAFDEISG